MARAVVVVGLLAGIACADDGFFTDVTQEAGLLDAGPYSMPPDNIGNWMWPAAAAGDVDRDGLPDLFMCAGPEGKDKLFLNDGDGTFTDHAAAWGVDASHLGMGVAVGDFNNDHWPDVFVSSWGDTYDNLEVGKHKLYRNNGDGTFTDVAASAGVQMSSPTKPSGFGASWGDYDLDGDLDLAVPGFFGGQLGTKLFRNNGDETFTDVTVEVLGVNMNGCYAFLMRFVDMNGDLAPDMYWVGDTKTSHYFKNDGFGNYSNYTAKAGLGKDQNGMGADIGDVNNDGLPDMYVSSIYGPDPNVLGNRLYVNLGNHQFDEIAVDAGVADGGFGWATLVQDLDLDGDCDLADTSGRSGIYEPHNDPLRVWLNDGDGTSYTEVPAMPAIDDLWMGRGLCWIDYDLDGDQDLVIMVGQGQPYLCRNDTPAGPQTSWLHVTLDTSNAPGLAPDGVGARVIATTGESTRYRWVASSSNFVSQNETAAHLGLADATVVDELSVEWPNGAETTLTDVPVNTRVTIVAEPTCVADMNDDGVLNILDFVTFQTLFQGGDPQADVNGDGVLNILDFVAYQQLFQLGCEESVGHDRHRTRH